MGSESTQIVAFEIVLDAYHEPVYLPRGVSRFINELMKLGATVRYARGFVPTESVYVTLQTELPRGTLLACGHTVEFGDLIRSDQPLSHWAAAIVEDLIGKMGAHVEDGIEKALEARQFSYYPLDAFFKGFRVVLKGPLDNASVRAAVEVLERAVRDVVSGGHWSYESIDEGEPFSGPLTRILDLDNDIVYSTGCKYAQVGAEFAGFPVLLRGELATPTAVLGHAAAVLRESIRSSQLDWSVNA